MSGALSLATKGATPQHTPRQLQSGASSFGNEEDAWWLPCAPIGMLAELCEWPFAPAEAEWTWHV
jgi:hypothetical protein